MVSFSVFVTVKVTVHYPDKQFKVACKKKWFGYSLSMEKTMREIMLAAIEKVGGQAKVAKVCGISRQAVSLWINGNTEKIPAEHAIPMEKATNGAISRYDLRPDIYPREE